MISIVRGDIFATAAKTLVNPVNCVGVSGRGLAKAFAERFPEAQKSYERACRKGQLELGKVFVVRSGYRTVVYFPTKFHWRDDSEIDTIKAGLKELCREVEDRKIESIAIPALGCGNGRLLWPEMRPMIVAAVRDLTAEVILYSPL